MSSLLKANWDRQAGGQTAANKYRDACASKNLRINFGYTAHDCDASIII